MKDNFSGHASQYARYRPSYPPELFEYIINKVPVKDRAWDCGTGNGQSALSLSRYFTQVIATDISSKQIENAAAAPNIFYSVQPAEQTGIADNCIDLVTVAQAIHWFDFEKFYAEVRRVCTKEALIAVWTYSLLKISKPIDAIISDYHYNFLGKYWDAERKYVDDKYRNIPFPFQRIQTPQFAIELYWSLQDLEGYLGTWSALQKFIADNNPDPVPVLVSSIRSHWGNEDKKKIIFPIHLLLGAVN